PLAAGLVAEEIGAAPDHQCDPPRDLGGGQPGGVGQRQTGQAGKRRHGADRQHGHRGADARAERQRAVVGCRARHDAALAASCGKLRHCRERRHCSGAIAGAWPKSARAIEYSRGKDNRRRLYGELIAATRATQAALHEAGERLADLAGIAAERWRAQLGHYLPLIERILAQSQRRVLDGQAVPASEKLVSLFEPHADIILKSLPLRRRGVPATCGTDTSSTWSPATAA